MLQWKTSLNTLLKRKMNGKNQTTKVNRCYLSVENLFQRSGWCIYVGNIHYRKHLSVLNCSGMCRCMGVVAINPFFYFLGDV